jgi:hypothetical protein
MYGKTFSLGLVSLLSLALPSVNAFATTGCYAAGAVSEILGDILTVRTTGIESPSECVVSPVPMAPELRSSLGYLFCPRSRLCIL